MLWILLAIGYGGWAASMFICCRWRQIALEAVSKYTVSVALTEALVEEIESDPRVVVLPTELSRT